MPVNPFVTFFFNDTATTEIYTLSLHDALPICQDGLAGCGAPLQRGRIRGGTSRQVDRKSTRLNSSHTVISYAVFCLKKKTSPFINDCYAFPDSNASCQKNRVAA